MKQKTKCFEMYPQLEDDIYHLSDYQKERIKKAREEWQNGQLVSNEDLFSEIENWLNEGEQPDNNRKTIV